MNTSEKLAAKLRLLREMHNYTQEYVADVLNVSTNTYSLLEKGSQLSIDRAEKLAQLYNMTLVDLINVSDQTIIHQITHSNGICSDNVNVHNTGLNEEERKFYKETIVRLEEQNLKLVSLIDKLSERIK